MTRQDMLAALRAARVVPVIRTSTAAHAATAVQWLREAGLTIFELTMTIPDAPALIRDLASDPTLLLGAGTVPDAATAERCLAAGARFIVAPWTDPALAAPCRAAGALLMHGALTPADARTALAAGADVVKIFPASSAGGRDVGHRETQRHQPVQHARGGIDHAAGGRPGRLRLRRGRRGS